MSQNNPNYKKLPYQDQAKLKQQYSLLADYSISIQDYDGGGPGARKEGRQSGFNLSLSQTTEIQAVSSNLFGGYRVSQDRSLELKSIMDNGDGYLKPGTMRRRIIDLEETSNITALMSENKLIGLDQNNTRDYSSKTNIYVGLGLSWEKQERESSEASSKVRQLDDLWAQRIDNSKEGYSMTMEINGAVIDEDSIMLKEYAEQQSTLTIIGDLDKLANDMGYRTKVLGQLREIDKLMEGKDESGSTLSTRA